MEYKEMINKVICADCIDIMKDIPNASIDFCCTDFPYNISNLKNSITKKENKYINGDFGEWDKWDNMEDYLNWIFVICKEIQRILKPLASCIFFFANKQAGWIAYELERRHIFVYKSPIIFHKNNPIPQIRKSGFRSAMEHGVWLINSQVDYISDPQIVIKSKTFNFLNQEDMKNVMTYNIGNNLSEHPTEKPIKLIGKLIEIFTNENDIVLDCFSGSGTACIASKLLNRKFIGIEKNEEYYNESIKRLESYNNELF